MPVFCTQNTKNIKSSEQFRTYYLIIKIYNNQFDFAVYQLGVNDVIMDADKPEIV